MFPLQHPVTHLRLLLSFDQVRHHYLFPTEFNVRFSHVIPVGFPVAMVLFRLHTLISLEGPLRRYSFSLSI